jgi:hypothetical protein
LGQPLDANDIRNLRREYFQAQDLSHQDDVPSPSIQREALAATLPCTRTFWPEIEPVFGGPDRVKHEGFKWVQRKHFFTRDLNAPI